MGNEVLLPKILINKENERRMFSSPRFLKLSPCHQTLQVTEYQLTVTSFMLFGIPFGISNYARRRYLHQN